jgi:hypothetical protein
MMFNCKRQIMGICCLVPKNNIPLRKILKPVLSIITQGEGMPDVTSDERGRRIFQIHKEKAVETAVEKIRQSLGPEWKIFSQEDTKILTDILGEAWVSVERSVWENASFTRLTRQDVEEIIRIGHAVKTKTIREEAAINEICTILKRSF